MPPGLSILGTVVRMALQEPALRHMLAKLGEESPTMRSVLGLDICDRDTTIGSCRSWWPPWPGRPVTHLRTCSTDSCCPSAHELHKGRGIRGKRWERRRTLDRQAERRAAHRAGHRLGGQGWIWCTCGDCDPLTSARW